MEVTVTQQTRPGTISMVAGAVLYPAALAVAEAALIVGYPVVGAFVHAAIFVLLLSHSATVKGERLARLMVVLALVPLTRLLSLLIPLSIYPQEVWPVIVGVPLLVAVIIAARATGMRFEDVGLDRVSVGRVVRQSGILVLGVVVAFAQYLLLRPAPVVNGSAARLLVDAVIVFIFTGMLEEIIYRGVIQRAAVGVFGSWGVLYSAVISVILVIDYQSVPQLALAFGTALVFGVWAARTRSIVGVAVAHGLLNVLVFIVFPLIVPVSVLANGFR